MKKYILILISCITLFSSKAFAQPANDECATAQNLGTLPAPAACPSGAGTAVTAAGTITAATPGNPYIYQNGCSGAGGPNMGVPANDVWYSFVASGYEAVITVNSTFANPNIAMYAGSCASLGGGVGGCAVGTGGTATLTVEQMVIGTTYYIQVSGNTGQTGTFNISVKNNKSCSDCLNSSTLTVSPLPVNGMYNPGQTVHFCYHINSYAEVNTNWLHGVQIALGAGWNAASLVASPVTSYDCGTWTYYPSGITDPGGQPWPAGFYFNRTCAPLGGGTASDGIPGNNYGDHITANTGGDQNVYTIPPGTWNFCFDVTVASGCHPGSNLSVIINTSGDGESGPWTSAGCASDPATPFNAVGACCPPTMSSTAVSCTGNDGSVTATPVGTSGPYNYSWTNSSGTVVSTTSGAAGANTVTSLPAGTYTVSLTNALNCVITNTVTITSSGGAPSTPTAGSNSPVCAGSTLNLTAANVTGATYSWSGPNSFSSALQNPAITNVTTAAAGTYTVTATVSGCTSSSTVTVVINPVPTVTVPASVTVCNGGSVAASAYTSTPSGATYAWTNSAASIGLAASGTSNTPAFTATNTGTAPVTATIIVTPTLAGCTGSPATYTITVNPTPNVTVPASSTVCNGATVPAATCTSTTTGTTFAWTNSNPSIGLAASGSTATIPSFTAVNTGTAAVTATISVTPAANGCTGTPLTYTITVNPTPDVVVPSDITVCNGAAIAATSFSSGVAGTTYTWTNSNTAIGLGANGSNNVPGFNGTNSGSAGISGTITVTPSANTCPGTPQTYTITVNPIPTVTVPANSTVCNSATVPATAFTSPVSGATYTWTNSNTAIGIPASGSGNVPSFTAANTSTSAITATITVTPAAGCPGTPGSYTITVNPTPDVTVPAAITVCNGSTVPAAAFTGSVTGTTYTWANSNTAIGLGTGGSGNTPSFTAVNSGSSPLTATITVTPAANTCTGTPVDYTITVNPDVAANAGPDDTICYNTGTSLNATPNSAGYSYSWLPATGLTGTTTYNPGASPSVTTTYTVTITDANGCTGSDSVKIYSDPQIIIAKTAIDVSCNGACNGQTIVIPSGGSGVYTYNWSSGCTTASCTNLCPGSYTVTVTDSWGCTATADTAVTEPPALLASITGQTPASCNAACDGTATAAASGGTPGSTGYAYSWNTLPAQNTAAASAMCAGPYAVTVTDSQGCQSTASVTITEPAPVVVPPIPVSTICIGSSTTITAAPAGGNGTYHYGWLPAGTGADVPSVTVSPVVTSTYTVNVTDGNGCTSPPVVATVNVNPPLTVTASGATAVCPGASAPISAVAGGGNGGPYTYNWGPAGTPSGTPVTVTPGTTTTYTVTATDNCGTPPAIDSVTITMLPVPVVGFTADITSGCVPLCVNFTDTTTIGSGSLSSWAWDFGGDGTDGSQNPATHCFNIPGPYSITLTVSSAAGCSATYTHIDMINAYALPDAEFSVNPNPASVLNSTVNFGNECSADVVEWNWDFGDGITSAPGVPDPEHTYPNAEASSYTATLTVHNSNMCYATVSHQVDVGPEFTFYIPNAFTPNGDGINDYFNGKGIGIDKYELFIFDRWGNNIFYTDSLDKPWDGKANHGSEMAQQDVYVWKVRLTDVFGKKHSYIGTVTIVK